MKTGGILPRGLAAVALLAAVGACKPRYHSPLGPLPADGLSGGNGGKLFPIGMWTNEAKISEGGTVPDDLVEAARYYAETFAQIKRWGFNTITAGGLDQGHAQALLTAANDARLGVNLGTEGLAVGPSAYFGGCTMPIAWTPQQAHDVALSQSGLWSSAPALLHYQTNDEPPSCALEPQRQLAGWLSLFDPAHRAFEALDSNFVLGATYLEAEKMLAYDEMVIDPYPLKYNVAITKTPDREPLDFTELIGVVDSAWNTAPVDKPIRVVLQAFGDHSGFTRVPTEIEERNLFYTALAHGAKGIYFFIYQNPWSPPPSTSRNAAAVDSDGDRATPCLGGQCPPAGTPYRSASAVVPALAHEASTLGPWLVDADRDDPHSGRLGGQGCGGAAGSVLAWTVGSGATDCDLFTFQTIFGEKMLFLVNKHVTAHSFTVAVDLSAIAAITAKGDLQVQDVLGGAMLKPSVSGSQLQVSDTLQPGDGRLYRLVSPLSADIRIAEDRLVNPIAPSGTTTVTAQLINLGSAAWPATSVHPALKIYPPGGTTPSIVQGALPNDVAPGASATVSIDVPASAVTASGTYLIGFDLVQGSAPWFANEQQVSIMVQADPLLVDTFDTPPYRRPSDFLWKWDRAPRASVRDDRLAGNGGGLMLSHYPVAGGTPWSDYTFELDVQIDSPNDLGKAGWAVRADASNGGSGYVFALGAADSDTPNAIVKSIDQGGTLTPAGTIALGSTITKGSWHHVRVDVAGGTITTYLDYGATPVDTWSDQTFTQGKVGFYLAEGDSDGNGLWRAHYDNVSVHGSATPPAPTAPQLLSAANVPGAVQLKWTRAVEPTFGGADVAGYRVYAGATAGGPYALVGATGAATFLDRSRTAGVPAFYVVTALAVGGGESARSNELGATLAPALAAVTNINTSAGTMKTMSLAWTAPAGSVNHYNVYRSLDPFFPSWSERSRVGSVSGTSFDDTSANVYLDDGALGLVGLRDYHYGIEPVDAAGNRGPVADVRARTFGSALFSDEFLAIHPASWVTGAGTWVLSGGLFAQTNANALAWTTLAVLPPRSLRGPLGPPARWGSVVVETTLEALSSGQGGTPSVGLTIHKPDPQKPDGGYQVAYLTNGIVTLTDPTGKMVAQADSKLAPNQLRRLRVDAHGWHYKIFVDGVKLIDWSDANQPAGADAGYLDLRTWGTVGQFDTVDVWVRDGFSDDLGGWSTSGIGVSASIDKGALVLAAVANLKGSGGSLRLDTTVADKIDMELDLALGPPPPSKFPPGRRPDLTPGGGVEFLKTNASDTYQQSGYRFVVYRTGAAALLSRNGVLATSTTKLAPASATHLKIHAAGGDIEVEANGAPLLSAFDQTFIHSGYIDLFVEAATARCNYFELY